MLTDAELMLRKVALLLTALLVIVGLWGGIRLLILSEPEAVLPAPSSLLVGDLVAAQASEDLPPDFVTRPVFWLGRTAYVATPRADDGPEPEPPARSGELDKVRLLGMFGTGSSATAIVSNKGKSQRLKLNESIEGWTFTFFSPDGAFFEKGTETRALKIEHAASSTPSKPGVSSRSIAANGSAQKSDQRASGLTGPSPGRDSKRKGAKSNGKQKDEDNKVKSKKNKSKKKKDKSDSDKKAEK